MGNILSVTPRSVLVVDDDPPVGELLRLVLEQQGYRPTVRLDPRMALDWVAGAPRPPDVALVDFLMPGMTGVDLAGRLRELVPGLPVIFLTGSIAVPNLAQLEALRPCRLMHKPFRLPELRETIESFFAAETVGPPSAGG